MSTQPWAASFPFDRKRCSQTSPTKESYSPPESGAVAPKIQSKVFHPSEFGSAPGGSDIKYVLLEALLYQLVPAHSQPAGLPPEIGVLNPGAGVAPIWNSDWRLFITGAGQEQ